MAAGPVESSRSNTVPALGLASGGWRLLLPISRKSYSWNPEFPCKKSNHCETAKLLGVPSMSCGEAVWIEGYLTSLKVPVSPALGPDV